MGNIDTKFVTADQLQVTREMLMKEIEKTGAISQNAVMVHKNDNTHVTIRLICKWICQLILAYYGISSLQFDFIKTIQGWFM